MALRSMRSHIHTAKLENSINDDNVIYENKKLLTNRKPDKQKNRWKTSDKTLEISIYWKTKKQIHLIKMIFIFKTSDRRKKNEIKFEKYKNPFANKW